MHKKYHLNEHPLPAGFRIYFDSVPVMGVTMRKVEATTFCKAQGRQLVLEREPDNRHDPNAIKVIGSWKGWFRRKSRLLGYVPAEMAAKLVETGVAPKVLPRLKKTYLGDDGFVEIEFQIIGPKQEYERLRSREPSPSQLRTPRENVQEQEKALTRLGALTAFLMNAPRLSPAQIDELWKAHSLKIATPMLETGDTRGQASEGPAFLSLQENAFRDHLRSIDNDLTAQVEIVDKACRAFFETGQLPAPYYAWRIAIILSKAKLKGREKEFLTAWCRHFAEGRGSRYGEIVERARKLGVNIP